MSSELDAIEVEGLGKRYRVGTTEGMFRYRSIRDDLSGLLRRRPGAPERSAWALRDVAFTVRRGETVGVIGHNGAGKSTLFKVLSRITPPTEGTARVKGRVGSLLEVGTGFHPELTGRENIYLAGSVLGMRRAEIAAKLDDIIDFSAVAAYVDTPVKRYSSGMYMRLAFAVAAHLEPEVLLVDEVLSVGDAEFQKKCLGRISDIGSSGRTVLFVSHSMPAVLRICPRVILLERGRVVADGAAADVVRRYLDSGSGTMALREWPDITQAPGDAVARLRAVRVRCADGVIRDEIDIREPFDVEIEYWNLGATEENPLCANFHLLNQDGLLLFATADFNDRAWAVGPRAKGLVKAVCRVPGNFLAEGKFFVNVAVGGLHPPHVDAGEDEAVAFQIVDRSDGDGARGEVVFDWPGVVRPKLDWNVWQMSDERGSQPAEGIRP